MSKSSANAYDDDDFDQIVSELDAEEEKLEAAKLAKRQADKRIKATAKELGIPLRALNPARRTKKAFRNIQKIAEGVHEDHVETHLDMVKRMLGDFADTGLGKAAIRTIEDVVDRSFDAEQREGEAIFAKSKAKPSKLAPVVEDNR